MSNYLFNDFSNISPFAWKQKIQVDLKGTDYNDALLWQTNEDIVVKPFYTKEDRINILRKNLDKGFLICQTIFVDDEKIANSIALNALQKGVTAIQFKVSKKFNYHTLLEDIDVKKTVLYFNFTFLDDNFQIELSKYINSSNTYFQTDIIGNLAETGNWYGNLKKDHEKLEKIINKSDNCIFVGADLYQNAGANITQQLAYALAHTNEYLNYFGKKITSKLHFKFSVSSNYFFEIAKLKAFRVILSALLKEYKTENTEVHILVEPSLRNKTLYEYNTNMLRTTTECMSAILGGANTIANVSYDTIYHKTNEFGERIARNQLLILQKESFLGNAQNYVEGTYYIESLTHQLAEKALQIFKSIEKGGGFLHQLKLGLIQKKIKESDLKEKEAFKNKELILLGTNLQENQEDVMKDNLELYPFVKQRNIKTLITPITRNRISEEYEQRRLDSEKL